MLGSNAHVTVRGGRPADAEPLLEVFRESWRCAYTGIIPHAHLKGMLQRRDSAWWTRALKSADDILVLDQAGEIAGYATFGPSRVRGRQQGEIYEIYLAPRFQGLGLGEHLFEGCRNKLDERRLSGLLVWALAENIAAQQFYWDRGGRPIARSRERIGGAILEKIAYAWD